MRPFIHIDVEQLGEALAQLGPNARPLAGGTDLLPLLKEGLIAPERLINLKALAELRTIRSDETGVSIGALTTLAELEQHSDVRRHWTALAEAAALSASPQLRNMATLGGNLLQQARCWYYRGDFHCWLKGGTHCHARDGRNDVHAIFEQSPCVAVYPSDPPAALLALDAEVQIVGAQGERRLAVAELLQAPSEQRRAWHTLADNELIVGVHLPRRNQRSRYLKAMDRAVWAYALVSVAVAAEIEQGVARNVRIVLGGVANTPLRASAAEALVEGRALDAALARQAGEAASAPATPLAHNRYKVALLRRLVAQALLDLVADSA